MRWTLTRMQQSLLLSPKLVVTGSHLSDDHGATLNEIQSTGQSVDRLVPIPLKINSGHSLAASVSTAVVELAVAFEEIDPWMVFLVGDRYETFAAATAAFLSGIPIAHCHGGETTLGSFDDAFRNSITHMSYQHFVSNTDHAQRVRTLGADPSSVHVVGALGLDAVHGLRLLSRAEIEGKLGIEFLDRNILVTLHPETAMAARRDSGVNEVLDALAEVDDCHIVFTGPNADPGSDAIQTAICDFARQHGNASFFPSLGQELYLSIARHVDVVVGNSSSALIEVPALGTRVLDIGGRQAGRPRAASVIHCEAVTVEVKQALDEMLTQGSIAHVDLSGQPYGTPGASKRIVHVLESLVGDYRSTTSITRGYPE